MNGCLVVEALLHPFVRDRASAASTALASETGGQDYHCTVIPFKSDRGENAYGLRYSRTACTLVILTADYNNAAVFSIIALPARRLVEESDREGYRERRRSPAGRTRGAHEQPRLSLA
jgi:hypothetical protein